MKKTDKTIIKILVSLLIFTVLIGLYLNIVFTLQIIGGILSIGYFIFLMLHLMLCFPSIMIGLAISDTIDSIFKKIDKHSIILSNLFRAVVITLGVIAVHFVWLYLSGAFILNNYNIREVFEAIQTL